MIAYFYSPGQYRHFDVSIDQIGRNWPFQREFPYRILKVNMKVVRFYRSIRQIEGLAKTKYPMNLILIILIFSRSIPRSNGTPSYNSAIRTFFADYSINSLSILKKLGTHTWNSLLNHFCSLCSIQMSIFLELFQKKLILTIYIHISKGRNSLKNCSIDQIFFLQVQDIPIKFFVLWVLSI